MLRLIILALALLPAAVRAEGVNAGDACSTAGAFHTKNDAAGSYHLVCNGSAWVLSTTFEKGGDVGVNVAAPKAPLHVAGEAIIGATTGLGCDADRKGGLRWSDADGTTQMCDGTDWKLIASASCDNAPAYPFFSDQTNLAVSTLATSNISSLTGMDSGCTATIGVSGTAGSNPEYRICSNSDCSTVTQTWTAANSTLALQGKYVQLRATSSASLATAMTISLAVGPISADWTISTGMTGCSPEGTVCSDGTVYAGLSGAATPMYVTRCDAGQSWGGSSCTGTATMLPWNNGNTTGRTNTSVTDGATTDGQGYTATLAAADSDSTVGGTQPHQAAQYCANLVQDGHSDWYLPAINEIGTLWTNRVAIGNFTTNTYWTSSEDAALYGYYRNFGTGSSTIVDKFNFYRVRCVRR